jgi:hypothetical protein
LPQTIAEFVADRCNSRDIRCFEGDIGIYGMAVLAYFSYGITILEILRYTVFGN